MIGQRVSHGVLIAVIGRQMKDIVKLARKPPQHAVVGDGPFDKIDFA
jgi:hypothetical protein